MSAKVQIDTAELLRVLKGIDAAVDTGVANAADLILDLAQQLAPEETGALKGSGGISGDEGSNVREVSFGNGLPDARALAQEFGTHDMPAQPFLIPASQNIDVEAEIAKEIARLIG